MSFSQMRPQTSELVELHVFYVPAEVWNFKLNTVPVALTSKFVSAGFIRVSPHITLGVLREKLGEYLGGVTVADKFKFLKCIGRKLAVGHGNLNELHIHDQIFAECSPPLSLLFHNTDNVKAKQETELELKSFAPPYALYPELYLLPGVEYFEDVYPLPSSTQQRHHFNAKASRFGHGPRLPSLPQHKPEKSKPFLESMQSKHQDLEAHSPVEWGEKEPLPVLDMNRKQDHNNRIQEEQIQFREKDQNGSDRSLFTPSHSNPADWGSGKWDTVLQTSEQNHPSQDQKGRNSLKWNDKAKGTAFTLHGNHSDERGQGIQTPRNHNKYQRVITKKEMTDTFKLDLNHCVYIHIKIINCSGENTFERQVLIFEWNPTANVKKKFQFVRDLQCLKGRKRQIQNEFRKALTNMENNEHQKETKLRRDGTQDAEILKIMERQTTEYVHKKQSLQQYSTRKTIADLGEKLDKQADESKQNHLTCPKEYIPPPSPPLLSVNPAQVPVLQAAKNKMVEQLQQMKKDRRHIEKTREELIKKAKGLLEQNKLRRYHVREEWKKKYFETKKATVSLEDTLNKLRQDLEVYHQKLLVQLEARDSQKRPNNTRNSKNYTIIRITKVQHELDHLQRKLDDTKMKLIIEIKMRKQAASDLRALRAELTQKKIDSALIPQYRK